MELLLPILRKFDRTKKVLSVLVDVAALILMSYNFVLGNYSIATFFAVILVLTGQYETRRVLTLKENEHGR